MTTIRLLITDGDINPDRRDDPPLLRALRREYPNLIVTTGDDGEPMLILGEPAVPAETRKLISELAAKYAAGKERP